jgi:uncharacterized protein YndB with AHSA1/START domain
MILDPKFDLVFERTVRLTPEQMFRAWTDPELIPKWFCPPPWKVSSAKVDLRPGGLFFTMMHSPENQEVPNSGCFLEIVKNEKVIWTDFFSENYQPNPSGFCVVILTFKSTPEGTLYKAIARHKSEEDKIKHEQMGFEKGWGIALDQMIHVMNSVK